jgi:hypothetical protein
VLSPYKTLPPLEIGGTILAVAEGTGAIRAYEAMVYGLEKEEAETKEKWKRLLLQYCKLDSLSMFFVWQHWKRRVAVAFDGTTDGMQIGRNHDPLGFGNLDFQVLVRATE